MSISGAFSAPALPSTSQDQLLRVCLLSTPRSGNNWLRYLLQQLLDIPTVAVHSPAQIDWEGLPRNVLVSVHWHPTSSFVEQLETFGFRVVVLVRHPLDVLISILHFAFHYSAREETQRWLEGEEGNERPIFAAMPRSTAFLDYATSRRAEALLAVGPEWWRYPGGLRVRYENLLRRPEETLNQLLGELGARPGKPIPEALAATTIDKLRQATGVKEHFWQGKEGLWRRLLPVPEATHIAQAHAAVFADLGYTCDPDPDLDGARADANWVRLMWADLAEDVSYMKSRRTTAKTLRESQERLADAHRHSAELAAQLDTVQRQLLTSQANHSDLLQRWERSQRTLAEREARLVQSRDDLGAVRALLASTQEALAASQRQLSESEQAQSALAAEIERVRPRVMEVADLGPRAIRVARDLSRVSRRYPRFASLVKWVAGVGRASRRRGQPFG